MSPRAGLVAQKMLRRADHPLADEAIVWVGPLRSQSTEPLRQCKSGEMPTTGDVRDPQARKRAQLILGIFQAIGDLESLHPGRADLGNCSTSVTCQRCAQCGVELHLAARVPARCGCKSGKRLLDPAAALLQQRQVHPQRHRGGGQRHANRWIPSGAKAQSSAARKSSICRP